MKDFGVNPSTHLPLRVASLPDLAAAERLRPGSDCFTALLLADTRSLSNAAIERVAFSLLCRGLTYLCAWGPGCERVHDIFDSVFIEDGFSRNGRRLMTTWHDGDPLDEALEFFITSAWPLDEDFNVCQSLVVVVGNDDWQEQVEEHLSNLPVFLDRMMTAWNPDR